MTDRTQVRVPSPVDEQIETIQKQHEYPTKGEAVRHAFREAGYDV